VKNNICTTQMKIPVNSDNLENRNFYEIKNKNIDLSQLEAPRRKSKGLKKSSSIIKDKRRHLYKINNQNTGLKTI